MKKISYDKPDNNASDDQAVRSLHEAEKAKFSKIFNALLHEWKQKDQKNNTQERFRKLFDPELTQAIVSDWKRGKKAPKKYNINRIIKVFQDEGFDIDQHTFEIEDLNDMFEFNKDYVDSYITEVCKNPALKDAFDTDSMPAFLTFLKTIPDYDEMFPKHSALMKNDNPPYYSRIPIKDLPSCSVSSYPEFQIDKGEDGLKLLNGADLAFIARLQKEVIDFILHQFNNRQKELNIIAERASALSTHYDYSECDFSSEALTDREIQLVDPDVDYINMENTIRLFSDFDQVAEQELAKYNSINEQKGDEK